MTPAERAVIDAARAYVAYYWGPDAPTSAAGAALYTAVRALPRPLSEQLAELRVGAVVEGKGEKQARVIANDPEMQELWLRHYCGGFGNFVVSYADITRIISNPEADRG